MLVLECSGDENKQHLWSHLLKTILSQKSLCSVGKGYKRHSHHGGLQKKKITGLIVTDPEETELDEFLTGN